MNRKLVGATKLNKLLLLSECTWIDLSRCLSMWFLQFIWILSVRVPKEKMRSLSLRDLGQIN